jgi:hypothetical protein
MHSNQFDQSLEARCWHHRAEELAAWADLLLVNRRDSHGGYRTGRDGAIRLTTKHEPLTLAILLRHFNATCAEDIVGLHSGAPGPNSLAKWIAHDIDCHDGDPEDPEFKQRFAFNLFDRYANLGMCPLLVASNGKGGYHVWVIFNQPVPLAEAYRLVRWASRDWSNWLSKPAEAFPKQAGLGGPDESTYGNWLRLFGRFKSRDEWCPIWNPRHERWARGADATDVILSHNGVSPAPLVTAAGLWTAESQQRFQAKPLPLINELGGTRYGFRALREESRRVASSAVGSRNDSLVRAAFRLGQLVGARHLDRAGVELVLLAAAQACGLCQREATATIRSGLNAGMNKPRLIGVLA